MTCDYSTIVESTNKILSEYPYPLTLRQIYYRLVANGMIPNKRSAYNSLSKWLVKAREDAEIDDTRIEDRTRSIIGGTEGYDSPEDFIETVESWVHDLGSHYTANLWADQDVYVEVWVEKDALSQVISRAAGPFRVTVCPSRGYSSYSYIKRVAVDGRLSGIDKPIILLDFRDHDPSGLQMTEDLQARFDKYGDGLELEVKRTALTIGQVKEHSLIPNPTKRADSRSAKYVAEFGDQCWELDAIPPDELQGLVTSSIQEHIDPDRWDAALKREEKDRAGLKERFANAIIELEGEPKL
jgi:hypothetical protein